MAQSVNHILERIAGDEMEALSDLVDQLTDKKPEAQIDAFTAVQHSQDKGLWDSLLRLMAGHAPEGVRVPDLFPDSQAQHRLTLKIYALFVHDPVPATQAVKRQVLMAGLEDAEPTVRRAAAELLGARHSSQALDALIAALQSDEDSEVRRAAANALSEIGDPAAVGPLVHALSSEDGLLRQNAREALVDFRHLAVARLTQALADSDDRMRWEAAKALSEIADPGAAPALVRALEDENGGIRWLAGEGLIALGRKGLPPLLSALVEHSESAWLREGAHHVLSTLVHDEDLGPTVAPVLTALDDVEPELEVIEPAHRALRRLQ